MYGDEDVSWRSSHPNSTKIVPLTIIVDRKDLRDLASAVASDEFRELFFVPAYLQAGWKPRGSFARAAKLTPSFVALARRLRAELKDDTVLARRVQDHARKAGQYVKNDDPRELVAYMMDVAWGDQFTRFRLRRPQVEDVDAFAKKYLPHRPSVEVRAAEKTKQFLDLVAATILGFDPTYLRRSLDRNLGVLDDAQPPVLEAKSRRT